MGIVISGNVVTCQRHGKLISCGLLLLLLLFFEIQMSEKKKKSDYPAQILKTKNSL